jgi:aspartate kinase
VRASRRGVIGGTAAIVAGWPVRTFAKSNSGSADLVVRNARVYTGEDSAPKAEAFAVRDGRIVWVGSNDSVARTIAKGTKVYDARGLTVGLAMRENLPLRVLSAFEDKPGTDIVAELSGDQMERNLIAGIAADRNEARITLTRVPDRPGTVALVISPIAEAGIQVDMIVHAATPDTASSDLTFTVPRASLAQAMSVIEQRKSELGYDQLISDDAVAKVSIVGVGIRSNPQLAARMFEVLADRQINLLAVSTSEIKVSALIAEQELELAVRVLHSAFGLDSEQAA